MSVMKWTRFERLMNWLFPARSLRPPIDRPGYAPGVMRIQVVSALRWKDRLRILVSGRLLTTTFLQLDVPVARALSVSESFVLAPGETVPGLAQHASAEEAPANESAN